MLIVFRNTHTCKSNSLEKKIAFSKTMLGFLSGLVVKSLPANAGDTWFDPWSGKIPHDPSQLSLCTVLEPVLWSPGTATIEAPTEAPWSPCSAAREATTIRSPCTEMKSSSHLLPLEKVHEIVKTRHS